MHKCKNCGWTGEWPTDTECPVCDRLVYPVKESVVKPVPEKKEKEAVVHHAPEKKEKEVVVKPAPKKEPPVPEKEDKKTTPAFEMNKWR